MGDGDDNGSASAAIDINGYDCVLTGVLNPDTNSVNPVSLENGSNEVTFDNLPPGDYTFDVKCDNDVIASFPFTIHDGAIIPDNDGLDDLVISDNSLCSLDNGKANYNFTDYQLLLIRVCIDNNGESYYDGLSIGTDYKIGNLKYILAHDVNSDKSDTDYLNLQLLTTAKDYSLVKTGKFNYTGINLIKGYKKEITPLLNSEVSAVKNEIVNLNIPVDQFTHFIIKVVHDNDEFSYSMHDVKTLSSINLCYLDEFKNLTLVWANFIDNSTFEVLSNNPSGSSTFSINMLWGLNIDNLKNLTNKIFNPKSYSILIINLKNIWNTPASNILGFIFTNDIIADGITKHYFVRDFIKDLNIIFNEDGSYKIADSSAWIITKIEGLILPSKSKAYISNLVTYNTSKIDGDDGSITFNAHISGFKGQGTAVLNPAESNLPINLTNDANLGLSFDNLIAGDYTIEIYDDADLIYSETNIVISEPVLDPEADFANVYHNDIKIN
ncbi:/ / hypothetical protein / 254633:258202 Reverse [Candidatus Hepatoplasma crinochetorum]|uniref:Uncharacterized protein n=1 Tax=Candidatus Hepatoplasma crinochetorum TaxID=295596 RepID=A0A0G7ZNL1_9MOLU|nr:/ / hypothetical protein / 254633:258202 Reverse [Candidatus Hepatoplasma crinochetorum]